MVQLYHQNVTPPLSGIAEHTLKLSVRQCDEGHAANGPQQAPTLWRQPQTGARLSSNEQRVFNLVSSIISSLTKMKNTPFVHQDKGIRPAKAAVSALLELLLVCVYRKSGVLSLYTQCPYTYGTWTISLFPVFKLGRGACPHLTGPWCNSAAVCNMWWISGGMQCFH